MNNKNISFLLFLFALYQSIESKIKCDTSIIGIDTMVVCSIYRNDSSLSRLYYTKNNNLDGYTREWYNTGGLKSITKYENGTLVDTAYTFYLSGKIKSRIVNDGLSLNFGEAGDTLGVTKMCNGKPCGRSRAWYHDKRLKSINNYNESGQKHGLCENWREDGTRRDSTVFENGKYVEERQYYTNGNIRHFNKYKNGVFWESYAWSPNGKPLEIIHNGTGKGTNYSEDGKTRYLREFKDGKEISCSIIPTED